MRAPLWPIKSIVTFCLKCGADPASRSPPPAQLKGVATSGQQQPHVPCDLDIWRMTLNKANLRDLIAATGLMILLKLDSNRRFFSPRDLEIWWMTLNNNMAPLLYYIKLCVSFKSIGEFKLELRSGSAQFGSKLAIFLSRVTLKFDRWPWKTIGHIFCTPSSFVHHFKAMDEFKLELQSWNAKFGPKLAIFCLVWPWNLMDNIGKQ